MQSRLLKYAAAGVVAVVVCLVLVVVLHRGAYKRAPAKADAPEVLQALEMLRGIAAHPGTAASCMASDAKGNARDAVVRAAEVMGKARSVERKDAVWFGPYLRVGVTCPRDNAAPYERYFYLRKDGGELRITGVEP